MYPYAPVKEKYGVGKDGLCHLILVLGNLRQEDCYEFRTSLGHTVSFRSDYLQNMGLERWLAVERTSYARSGPSIDVTGGRMEAAGRSSA